MTTHRVFKSVTQTLAEPTSTKILYSATTQYVDTSTLVLQATPLPFFFLSVTFPIFVSGENNRYFHLVYRTSLKDFLVTFFECSKMKYGHRKLENRF